MSKPLEYLDLELKYVQDKISLDHMHYFCFAEGKHKHRFHTEDQQLNFLCDTSYLLFTNLHIIKNFCFQSIEYLKIQTEKTSQKISVIEQKLEYIKQQQELLTRKSKRIEQPLLKEVEKLESQVQKLSEAVSKLL